MRIGGADGQDRRIGGQTNGVSRIKGDWDKVDKSARAEAKKERKYGPFIIES